MISAVEALNEADYSKASWSNLQTALTTSKDVVADLTTVYNNAVYAINSNIGYEQADADMYANNILNAIAALVEKQPEPSVDKSVLETLLNKANELDLYAYKDFKPVIDALFDANGVLANEKATQALVDAVLKVLQDAIDPETFNVIPGKNSVTFEWLASTSDDVAYYELVSLPSHEVIKRVTTTSFVWENLEAGISGKVMLCTYDEAGNRSSGIQSGYITLPEWTAPAKVENVVAKDSNYKTVEDTTLAVTGVMSDASNTVKESVEKVSSAVTLTAATKSIKVSWGKVKE